MKAHSDKTSQWKKQKLLDSQIQPTVGNPKLYFSLYTFCLAFSQNIPMKFGDIPDINLNNFQMLFISFRCYLLILIQKFINRKCTCILLYMQDLKIQ